MAGYARVIRGATLVTREEPFVAAAEALGGTRRRIMARHIVPNLMGPITVLSTSTSGASFWA